LGAGQERCRSWIIVEPGWITRLTIVAAVLALLSSAMWGTADFLGGLLSKRLMPLVVVVATQSVGLVTVIIAVLLAGAWDAPRGYIPWAVVAGLTGATGLLLFYRALAIGTMGVVAPISAMSGLVPFSYGLLQGERFTTMAALGAGIIAVGVILASGPELRHPGGWQPLVMVVIATVLFGIALLAIARGSEYSALMTMASMRVVSVTLFGSVLAALMTRGIVRAHVPRELWWAVAAAGALDVLANVAYGLSANAGPLVLTAVLGSLYPVVTALLAAVFLRERLLIVQYIGVAAALTGLVLITTS